MALECAAMSRKLTDKVVLITGASSGIGAATAIACAQAGMDVTLAARREDKLAQVAERVRAIGRRAEPVVCDVALNEDVRKLFEQSWATHGRLDVVFANAGYGLCSPVMEMSDEAHRHIFEVNYFGTLRCVRHGIADLRRTADGLKHMMICSSAVSEIALPRYGAYCATKAAQDSIAGSLRAELNDERIAVTSVHPGGTETEFFEVAHQLTDDQRRKRRGKTNTPAMLVQTAEKVGRSVVGAIRRPRPEVWPTFGARYGLAFTTAFPRVAAWVMRNWAHRMTPMSDDEQVRGDTGVKDTSG